MNGLIRTKNFFFQCVSVNYQSDIEIYVRVLLDGKENRFIIETISASDKSDKRPFVARANQVIRKFLHDWLESAMPHPESNYMAIMAKANFAPWLVVGQGRQLGKQQTTKLFIDELVKGNQVIPSYSTITLGQEGAATLYSAPESPNEWASRILDGACVKAMAGDFEQTKINHPLFGEDSVDMVWRKFEENTAISDEVSKQLDTVNAYHAAINQSFAVGAGYLQASKDGIRHVDSADVLMRRESKHRKNGHSDE